MAAKHKAENRARPGSIPWPEPRPLPWPGGGQGAPWSADWWRAQFATPARIREWIAQELTTGRLLPWFAVAYGAGVVLYFAAEREPVLWAPSRWWGSPRSARCCRTGRSCRKRSHSM